MTALQCRMAVLVAWALSAGMDTAVAQDPPTPESSDGTVVGPSGERLFSQQGPQASDGRISFVQVAGSTTGGLVVNPLATFELTRLPATFAAKLDSGELCTATLIGPRVLLTAAHCIDQKFQFEGVWRTVQGSITKSNGTGTIAFRSCTMAPAYTADDPVDGSVRNEHDYALCELVSPFGETAESLDLDPAKVAERQRLMIAGFGCTNTDLTDDRIVRGTPNRERLNVGFNQAGARSRGWVKMSGEVGSQDAILCPGDSGGAVYADVDLTRPNDRGWRIVAVNSMVGPGEPAGKQYTSYLSPISNPEFRSFATGWAGERPSLRKICGLTLPSTHDDCRR